MVIFPILRVQEMFVSIRQPILKTLLRRLRIVRSGIMVTAVRWIIPGMDSITYTTAGTYTVTLTNTFAGCNGTVSKTVNVVNAPVADFTATNTGSCKPPLTTQFTDISVGSTTWLWNFGDGTTSTIQNPVT